MPDIRVPCLGDDPDLDGVMVAATVNIGVCKCPHIIITLLDDDGTPIATGLMTPDDWAHATRDISAAVTHLTGRAPVPSIIGPTEGSA